MSELSVDQQIAMFLAVCRTASLATVTDEGTPHAANIQYASAADWSMVWVSSPSAEHSRHIAREPYVSLTVYAHQDEPENIHGLQIRGMAQLLEGEERERALALYTAKYPFVAEAPFNELIPKQGLYHVTPVWLRWIDNRRGFGWKMEKSL